MEERKEKKKSRRIRRIGGWGGRREGPGIESDSPCVCLKKAVEGEAGGCPSLHAKRGLSQFSQRLRGISCDWPCRLLA